MKRVMLTVAYDGTNYHGWQIQPNGNSIEEELNRALSDLCGCPIVVSGASRTDTGVHALCNLAVFDTEMKMSADKFSYALNTRLPEDIRIVESKEVALDFHPRFVDTVKTYEYRIYNAKFPDPMKRLYTHHSYLSLDVEAMNIASKYLYGEHDFKSFCSANAQVESTVRTITGISVSTTNEMKVVSAESDAFSDFNIDTDSREIVIRVSGTGFLYNMVRIIAGTLIEVGRGAIMPSEMESILQKKDRNASGPTAPAKGLRLVKYEFL